MPKKILLISLVIIFTLVIFIVSYNYFHPTHYMYNDKLIIGNDCEDIVDIYGNFDFVVYNQSRGFTLSPYSGNNQIKSGWYLISEETASVPEYYVIYFDENGTATNVKRSLHPGG